MKKRFPLEIKRTLFGAETAPRFYTPQFPYLKLPKMAN